ncbi:MAG TPA: hypothetical protein ENF78_05670 [Candidatus Bathyarchaeota archaeon]|nr:hypothetical protein [Candidatus Bathyarchaeota archaeon]
MAGAQGRWVKLRGYVCLVCGKRMWATQRPDFCPKCRSNVIRKTKDFRLSCNERGCKHNSEGRYCKLKEPRIEGGECLSFEPREKK